jgi:SAGA-associated factor 29
MEVFYRNKARATEGEGILCIVTSVSGEGKQRRYEIIDADPEPPTPPQATRASVTQLVPIPPSNASLPNMEAKKPVFALYPGTTTFYKAEVVSQRDGQTVRLKFEGEEEAGRETDVERRYVLPDSGK